ncbi:MAG: pyridoxamine 5'-phosphate oxidase family protein [Clostridia bacterium]|nr:pyridoxamine 5'-phosphate oxidase family protein [Clostridia bacterium]
MSFTTEIAAIMDERFGHDTLIALATINGNIPSVRTVNAFYEDGAFYTITHARSNKMKQIENIPTVGLCGEWFTGHGFAESLGHILRPENDDIADKLRTVFAEWYHNGHINESDPHTIILRIRLTDGVLFHHGVRHDLIF